MNGLTTLSRMMQRPSATTSNTQRDANGPPALPPIDTDHADTRSGFWNRDVAAMDAAKMTSPVAPPTSQQGANSGTQANLAAPSSARSSRDGIGPGVLVRPPLGPRGGSVLLPPGNGNGTNGTNSDGQENANTPAPKPKVGHVEPTTRPEPNPGDRNISSKCNTTTATRTPTT
jgi:hypothetical protein